MVDDVKRLHGLKGNHEGHDNGKDLDAQKGHVNGPLPQHGRKGEIFCRNNGRACECNGIGHVHEPDHGKGDGKRDKDPEPSRSKGVEPGAPLDDALLDNVVGDEQEMAMRVTWG